MLTFFLGMMVGGVLGVVTMCLCIAAGSADRRMERSERDWRK